MKDGFDLTVKFRMKYLALYVIVIVGCVVTLTIGYSRADDKLRQTISFGSSLLGATVAICTLLYTAQTMRRANDEKKSVASAKFLERWNNPSYFTLKTDWRALNEEIEPLSPEARYKLLDGDLKKRTVAVEILNFYEEIAANMDAEAVDEELLKNFFRTLVTRYYEDYEYWIGQHRKTRRAPAFCSSLEKLARRWKGLN